MIKQLKLINDFYYCRPADPNNELVINKNFDTNMLNMSPSPLQILAAPRAVGNATATKYINLYYKYNMIHFK